MLLLKSEKNITDNALQAITNLQFEFEDARMVGGKQPLSQIIQELYKVDIGKTLPAAFQISGMNKVYEMPVRLYKYRAYPGTNFGAWRD